MRATIAEQPLIQSLQDDARPYQAIGGDHRQMENVSGGRGRDIRHDRARRQVRPGLPDARIPRSNSRWDQSPVGAQRSPEKMQHPYPPLSIRERMLHAKLQAIFSCGLLDSVHYVSAAVFPRAALYAVIGLCGGPEAEPVVVLGHEDHVLDSGGLQGLHPLFGIELRRVEYFRIGGAVTPFAVEEGVWTEVDDGSHFKVLPFDLLRRGF